MAESSTTISKEMLLRRSIDRDLANAFFRDRFRGMLKGVKPRPGGRRRNFLCDQVVAGNINPWAQVLERIDLLIDEAKAPEENVMPFAQAFVDYVQAKYSRREVDELSPKTALKLAVCSDADEIKSCTEAIVEESPANLERALESLEADTRCNQVAAKVLRRRVVESRLRVRV